MFDFIDFAKQTSVISSDVIKALPNNEDIQQISPLFWEEHCLECSAPECYSSCSMFENNRYGKCKRLEYSPIISSDERWSGQITKIKYRKWSKLRCKVKHHSFISFQEFVTKNRKHRNILERALFLSKGFSVHNKRYNDLFARYIHHRYVTKDFSGECFHTDTDGILFIIESYEDKTFQLMLDAFDINDRLMTKKTLDVVHGLNTWYIPINQFGDFANIEFFELYPYNNVCGEIAFYFSDLVRIDKTSEYYSRTVIGLYNKKPAKHVKCVVWDLDNTLWEGVIGDCGENGLIPNAEAVELVKKLDERGIIQSISSKNDYALAWAGVKKLGLEEYFLYPQINWKSKSGNILNIVKSLNINVDTVAFIDDSNVEREEISSILSSVRVYDEKAIPGLLCRKEFDVPVTEDSKNRRIYYLNDKKRKDVFEHNESKDYEHFIKDCHFCVQVEKCICKADIDRCHELIQRTNQLNASTNRIEYDEFVKIVNDYTRRVLLVKCSDKFGRYGTVGCLILDNLDNDSIRCTDFVISCRVAKKKLESALISALSVFYGKRIDIVYIRSERNNVLFEEFVQIGGKYCKDTNLITFQTIKDSDWMEVVIDEKLK